MRDVAAILERNLKLHRTSGEINGRRRQVLVVPVGQTALTLSDIARAIDAGRIDLESEPSDAGLLPALAESGGLSYATALAIARSLGIDLRIAA